MHTSVAIIVAMESERRHLDILMPGWEQVESTVWRTLRNDDVVCIVSGIGMVAAAAATEHVISTYNPTMVLNFGCAGAHTRDLYPGDVVIGDRLVHHGRMRFAADGTMVPLEFGFTVPGEIDPVFLLESNHELAELAMQLTDDVPLPVWPKELRVIGQPHRHPEVRLGTISSGDIWLQEPGFIDAGHDRTGSLCEDMEAAGIAQVCALHGLPFLSVKDISNSEFHMATTFEGSSSTLPTKEVGLRSATIVSELIALLRRMGRLDNRHYS